MRITIGITTWNRAALLKQTLEGLTQLHVPPGAQWEVLVCDNNSTDQTRATIESMTGRLPVKYLLETRQGQAFAHNAILEEATGDWLLFLDDDVLVDPGWLGAYLRGVEQHPSASLLGGPILPWLDRPARGLRRYLLDTFPWVFGILRLEQDTEMGLQQLPHGANMAIRRDALSPRGFDTQKGIIGTQRVSGEDTDLLVALLNAGYEGWMLADAKVSHYIPPERMGFRWFCGWHMGQGNQRLINSGPAPRGRFGLYLWVWRLVAKRVCQALCRWRPGNPRHCFECLADACVYIGYMQASRAARRSKRSC